MIFPSIDGLEHHQVHCDGLNGDWVIHEKDNVWYITGRTYKTNPFLIQIDDCFYFYGGVLPGSKLYERFIKMVLERCGVDLNKLYSRLDLPIDGIFEELCTEEDRERDFLKEFLET